MEKIFKTMDGNEAAAHASYAFSEVAGIYPITPSSPIAEHIDEWAAQGKKNLFGSEVKVVEMQSEAGAAGFVHGSLQSGALTTTFTASQGLLLKIPNMYKIAGEMLPCVIHVTARSLATHALSIFGDQQDIYAVRQTGFAMLCSNSVQEVMDLAGIAHLSAIKGRVPFVHFYDGFRTSHEIQKIEVMDYSVFDRLLDKKALADFRNSALSPNEPKTAGTAQNEDIYFQMRELTNPYYKALPDIVASYMREISAVTGRNYAPFTYYGDKNATDIIVAMGSVCECAKEVVDSLKGQKVGVLCVHLYRPFSEKYFFDVLPKSVERIAVLDRTKEPGSIGEPLYLDVCALFAGKNNAPKIIGGRYGLSSKDVSPDQIIAVFKNLSGEQKNGFTIGINDDVSFTSLECGAKISLANDDATECLFFGLGSDGTVGANKNSIKIIGDKTDFYAQAYFAYDSKKSGGYTRSHLRFSKSPIRSTYLVSNADFIACSVAAYLDIFDIVENLKEGGIFLLNTIWGENELLSRIPNKVKRILAQKKAKFYIINATKLARQIGLKNRTNTIMQSAFFKLANIIPFDEAQKYMKEYAYKTYHKKGDDIVEMNYKAIDEGAHELVEIKVDSDWASLSDEILENSNAYKGTEFVENIVKAMNAGRGDELPVSAFVGHENGCFEAGTTQYEKRGVGVMVPKWIKENCIQCNECAFVCPHAVIRPFLIDENELNNAPKGVKEGVLDAKGKELKELKYKIQVSPLDCTGCELCATNCPSKEKSLVMVPFDEQKCEQENADYLFNKVRYKDDLMSKDTPKGAMFAQPLFEFHGACPGCGETPYLTTLTRLFGQHLRIANATGCSSIYGGSAPSMPYRKSNESGKGVAWANSLFEDNAEFGLGMHVAENALRDRVERIMRENKDKMPNALSALFTDWLENKENTEVCARIYDKIVPILKENSSSCEICEQLYSLKNYISKTSQWIVGGDGWAYDIGYGGLDHVFASGQNVNILVLDTEVYSNTGGQSSKSSQAGSIAHFAASGKQVHKKDLGRIAMVSGNVYVAQINSNANQAQVVKALKEAQAYNGVSLVIAYSPCIAHGIKGGLNHSAEQGALATKCGYFPTYTYNPELIAQGKNPLKITSKEPDWSLYENFLLNETRYQSLKKLNPAHADELLALNKRDAMHRYKELKRIASADYSDEIEG